MIQITDESGERIESKLCPCGHPPADHIPLSELVGRGVVVAGRCWAVCCPCPEYGTPEMAQRLGINQGLTVGYVYAEARFSDRR